MSDTGRVPVTFEPSGAVAWVEPGQTVLAAGRAAGVNISAPCGGRGVCGQCGVRVLAGELAAPTADEKAALKRTPAEIRLACRATIVGPVTLRPIVVNSTVARGGEALGGDAPVVVGVDLGTTTVSAAVLEESTGRQVGFAVVLNRQQGYGADVLSRVSAAMEGQAGELRRLAEESILDAIDSAAPRSRERVARVVIAANVAMAALLCGADVSSLASHPFSPPIGSEVLPEDSRLHTALSSASWSLVPPIAGFVGGDVVAGLLSLGEIGAKGGCLLVDIGTNAEVALVREDRMWVSSAAAGPAFEGGGISCGGPAAAESVVEVSVEQDGEVVLRTLGDAPATWFSGAGLVSAVSALRKAGHLEQDGRLLASGPLGDRFSTDSAGVLGVALGDPGGCLSVTQHDVRAFQLAKAAVQVAVATVLKRAGTRASKLEALYVSGAFGAALSPDDLVDLGIVPKQARTAVKQAGNTSLRGAAAIAMEPGLMERAKRISHSAQLVDLAADAEFASNLIDAVSLRPFSA